MSSDLEADKVKIKQILTATIVSLCNNGLSFESELSVEGLLGITLDKKDVLLVNIKEIINNTQRKKGKPVEGQSPAKPQPPKSMPQPQQSSNAKFSQAQSTSQNNKAAQQQQFHQQPQQTPNKSMQQPNQVHPTQQHSAQNKTGGQNQGNVNKPQQPTTQQSQDYSERTSQESFTRVKTEPNTSKVVTESQTQCMAMQPYAGGYAQVQKSVKMVHHAQGVVEQKQMEWKTYTADGRVVEHKKVQEVATVAPPHSSAQGNFQQMGGYPVNIKVEPNAEDEMMYDIDDEYYGEDGQVYDDYEGMGGVYDDGSGYNESSYQDPNQFGHGSGMEDPGMQNRMEGMGRGIPSSGAVPRGGGGRGGRGRGVQKPPAKRQKKEKIPTTKPNKNAAVSQKQQQQQQQQQPAAAMGCPPPSARPMPSSSKGTPSKDANTTGLVQRALDLVNDGKLSAATAINLFGIPKSTFYKKLAMNRGGGDDTSGMDGMDEEGWDEGAMSGDMGEYLDDPNFANYVG